MQEAFQFLGSEDEHVLVFDQFEEFFTYYPDRWADREPFFEQVSDLLESKKRLRILFVIREEFVSRLEPFAHHVPEEFQIRLFLERLRAEQAKLAVRGPFQTENIEFESEALLDSFVDSLRRQLLTAGTGTAGAKREIREYIGEFVEPVQLQVVCHSLAKGIPAEASRITRADIDLFGNPDRSLMQFYEEALNAVARECRASNARLRSWFEESMITQGGTRGTVFMGSEDTNGLPNRVVQALEAAHVIRSEQRAGAVWCEITHDLLLAPIQESNRKWRGHRKRLMSLLALSVLVLLVVAAAISEVLLRREHTNNLVASARNEGISEARQLTAKELFERAVIVEGNLEGRNTQKEVADLLADFLVNSASARQSALKNLTAGLKQAWQQDRNQTVRSIDRGLALYPAMQNDVSWPAVTEDVRECRRQLLSNLTSVEPREVEFIDYIRQHNAAIVISTAEPAKSAYELSVWKGKGFPGAILSPVLEDKKSAPKPPGSMLVIADYFLPCPAARDLAAKLNADEFYGKKRPFVVSYYSDCPPCGYYRSYHMFELPKPLKQAAP
jgi:hypothetical protein